MDPGFRRGDGEREEGLLPEAAHEAGGQRVEINEAAELSPERAAEGDEGKTAEGKADLRGEGHGGSMAQTGAAANPDTPTVIPR